ncbi:ubiquitin carboxyl-terminal hydrolase domain-containing protein [Phthorimaea operculella]|nr:ubiquitin carboxyl-terminal hydrolase domain-containing protein [Phthorimaea operculella]
MKSFMAFFGRNKRKNDEAKEKKPSPIKSYRRVAAAGALPPVETISLESAPAVRPRPRVEVLEYPAPRTSRRRCDEMPTTSSGACVPLWPPRPPPRRPRRSKSSYRNPNFDVERAIRKAFETELGYHGLAPMLDSEVVLDQAIWRSLENDYYGHERPCSSSCYRYRYRVSDAGSNLDNLDMENFNLGIRMVQLMSTRPGHNPDVSAETSAKYRMQAVAKSRKPFLFYICMLTENRCNEIVAHEMDMFLVASGEFDQPCSEDEEPAVPTFDRSTKPAGKVAPSSDMRHRDLDPCWGQVGRGLTGLRNLGNTCYMNSILQCLNNTTVLITYFCNGQYLDHINRSNSTRGMVAEEFAVVVRALWSGQYKFIAAKDLRNELGKHQRAFKTTEQQDSHEFLTILMDWLHLDLQIYVKPPPRESWTASDKAWYEFTRGKESLISRLFYGQIKSTVRCTVCGKTSVTYDSFSNLSLELPVTATRCTLSDCLKLYLNGETIPGWNCPACKEKRDAVKKLDISRLPPVLVIHFKRFGFFMDKESFTKKMTYIDFPLTDLDMKPFAPYAPTASVYDLYAVSNHYGSMASGHYTAFCKSSMYSKWYHYDDHAINEIPASDVKSSAAYILFYSTCRTA